MNGYNPMQYQQYQLDSLDNQIQMLNQRKAMLQQQMQPAPIQQTFIQQPAQSASPQNTFDFNGKWVNGIEEAKQLAGDHLPLLIFDKSNSTFYMKQLDGSMLAYEYKPVPMVDPKDAEIQQLKQQLAQIQSQLDNAAAAAPNSEVEEPKAPKRGGTRS